MLKINTSTEWYFLPSDSERIVKRINDDFKATKSGEIHITAFIMTPSLFPELLSVAKRGIEVYILHDKTQWNSDQKRRFKPLIDAGVQLTLSASFTKDKGTKAGYETMHDKSIVIDAATPIIWTGGMNFTFSGTLQINKMSRFSSKEWRDIYIGEFIELWEFSKKSVSQRGIS